MGFYLLSEGIHYKMDMGRANFYWESLGSTHKYHMVRWRDLCSPTVFGGLGFVESRARNISLLSKWIMKLERGDQDMCCQILRKKYCSFGGFFQSSSAGGSQFWKGLHSIKNWVKRGVSLSRR
jgi:hypothetical protein